ncbi:MAG: glycosyltransferase, partial [Chloroflexota bacterium]
MRILLLGQSPLPVEGGNQINAPGVRAWHFGRALAQAGHRVRLVAIQTKTGKVDEPHEVAPGLVLQPATETEITAQGLLTRLEAEFEPDGLIGASVWPSYLLALFGSTEKPLWGDLFGSPLAEGQAKAALYGDDRLIEPFARFEATVLERADAVSGVSRYQEYALVGALAAHGRLNRYTYGRPLAYNIPAALDDELLPHDCTVIRGTVVPEDAFVVLWSGGYNTWTDVETLFAGLEGAMSQNPRLHFVSTGGALPPHDSLTYPHLQTLIENSPYRERYHLLGWLPYEGLQNYYYESDLGIILDKWSYEGVLGSRTRLLDWLKYGLPAAITLTAELTQELAQVNLAFPFPHGDGPALTRLLSELATNPAKLQSARERASDYAMQNFHYLKTCAPLLAWAEAPRRASDAGQTRPLTL